MQQGAGRERCSLGTRRQQSRAGRAGAWQPGPGPPPQPGAGQPRREQAEAAPPVPGRQALGGDQGGQVQGGTSAQRPGRAGLRRAGDRPCCSVAGAGAGGPRG